MIPSQPNAEDEAVAPDAANSSNPWVLPQSEQSVRSDAEQEMARFLTQTAESHTSAPRVKCEGCNCSRSTYCFDCYKLLLPKEQWPSTLRDGSFRLPFKVDVVLDDRPMVATGVQVATLLKSAGIADECGFRLINVVAGDDIPDYDDGVVTYMLFPGPGSLPLSHVAGRASGGIQRLVVLDCKWSKPSVRLNPALKRLRCVHLDCSPKQSYFWRWHSSGKGMVSTVEALYYSAWEVAKIQGWDLGDRQKLVPLFWLFAMQREVIRIKCEAVTGEKRLPHLPFTEDGKEYRRAMRDQKKMLSS